MYGGRVRFTVPLLWSIGFMGTFVIGGMSADGDASHQLPASQQPVS